MTLPATGLHTSVPFEVYASWDAVNISRLKPMSRSPLHCRWSMDNPRPPSDAMLLGSALHAAVFEPAKFEAAFAPAPQCDRRTKDGRASYEAALASAGNRTLLAEDQYALVESMAEAVTACRSASWLLRQPGQCEVSAVWTDPDTRLGCKARFDRLTAGGVIIELKTTRDAAEDSFSRDMARFHYDAQAAFYVEAHKLTGRNAQHVFIAVENEPPHAVAVYTLAESALQVGTLKYRRWLNLYADCLKAGVWPGYKDSVEVIDLPRWAQIGQETFD